MLPRSRRLHAALVALVVALLSALVAAGPAPAAQAAGGTARVYGEIRFPQHDSPSVKMLWFDKDWRYLGQQWANGGGYSIRLAPGTYHLQFVDQRQPWVTKKYAPTDVQVSVGSSPVERNVTMRRGASITGVARAHGKPLVKARVVAAKRGSELSFSTTANDKGEFAVAGLPQGQYCLFTWDRAKKYVDKCTWAGAVKPGQIKNKPVNLRTKAGSLTVFLETATGGNAPRTSVTVTSRASGQWWTATSSAGKAVFRGLYPGGYTIKYDGVGIWLTQTGTVRNASVRPGAMDFGDFRVTKRGAWVTGTVVDGGDPTATLADADVQLFDASGRQVARTVSDADGGFELTGPLTTQSGLTVVVGPKRDSGGWMQGGEWCMFDRGSVEGVSIVTSQPTEVGDVVLERSTAAGQRADCLD